MRRAYGRIPPARDRNLLNAEIRGLDAFARRRARAGSIRAHGPFIRVHPGILEERASKA
jgi:hypothetical protein